MSRKPPTSSPGPTSPPPQKDTPEDNSLVSASAQGAKFLILLQVASRFLTFAVNQLLLQFLSPAQLGLSVQLELFTISILYFSRESLRNALQRQTTSASATNNAPEKKKNAPELKKRKPQKDPNTGVLQAPLVEGTPAADAQTVVNLSILTLPLGVVFSAILGTAYAGFMASPEVSSQPYFYVSVMLYVLATMLELLSEPAFAIAQQRMLYKIRASAEWTAAFARCIVTFGATALASWLGLNLGPLPFALGQIAYGVAILGVYAQKIWPISEELGFRIGMRMIQGKKGGYYEGYFHKELSSLAVTMWVQSAIKHVLTQGDSLLVAWLTTIHDQGIYALAANYGSLVARMLFQPLEESSRNLFAKLLAPSSSSSDTSGIQSALRTLKTILRLYSLISILAISLGPPFAPLGLSLVAGRRWAESAAGETLGTYCYYIPLLAINGITEAFVQAVATPHQLRQQSAWMLSFSIGFGVAGFFFVRTLEWGAQGLVWANVVNMALRICWSSFFIERWFKEKGVDAQWKEVLPQWGLLAIAGGVAAVARGVETDGMGLLVRLMQAGALAVGLMGACGALERRFLMEVWRTVTTGKL